MYIMTANGWKQLTPRNCEPAPAAIASNGTTTPYKGQFPSKDICNAFNSFKEQLKYFDDGVRMVYGKPDKIVETDNATPIHPIPNPPIGF